MVYKIENDKLKVQIDTKGAEVVSVVCKESGDECMWCGDPSVWGRHAPILFPYTGKLTGGAFTAKGGTYTGGQHGFARDVEHRFVEQSEDRLVLELRSNEETRAKFPYEFVLRSVFTLEGNTLHHTLEVENPAEETLQFGIGYHPAFTCPFDENHDTEDYEFRFDKLESPLVIDARPNGLLSGKNYYLGANLDTIQLTDHLFDNDSYCMVNLKSSTLGIYEKDSDRSIVCSIEGYPYTLIWSQLTEKIRFVCIEPWHSLTGSEEGSQEWEKRPVAACLKQDEVFRTTLSTTFNR
ncbi:MAG: aldose 1-epimerase family protein [Lachnospiraceae bacterium]|nr:aldose 1-epimerase family protein [Lachnospiraceae bacterium]